jgi:hypothetical protein
VKDKTKPVYTEVKVHKKKPLRWVTFCEGGQPENSTGRKKALKGLSREMHLSFDDMFG